LTFFATTTAAAAAAAATRRFLFGQFRLAVQDVHQMFGQHQQGIFLVVGEQENSK
jgi:cell division protein FtsX